MIQAHIFVNWHQDVYMECFFPIKSHSYTRGHYFKLKKTRGNMVSHISTLFHVTVSDLDCLPLSVVLSSAVSCFKSRLDIAWE